ncbi:MAG: mevalonate kinase [Candidatus Bathyarchaeia archaeon]
MKLQSKASAPAKAILFGEHFVVYDRPAVVMAIDRRAYVTVKPMANDRITIISRSIGASGTFTLNGEYQPIKGGWENEVKLRPIYSVAKSILSQLGEKIGLMIEIDSAIPVAAGLGSSAAVSVASTAAISNLLELNLSKDNIFKVAYDAERVVHGNPSGVDPAISTYGGFLIYRKSEGIKRLNIEVDLPLIVGDTRVKRTTGEMVSRVGELRRRYLRVMDKIMDAGETIADLGVEALRNGDLRTLGELMNINHALLYAIGVSNETIERLINAARGAGALGAKLTGAGGGGCIIALSEMENASRVAKAIENAGGKTFITRRTLEGVKVEEQ